MKGFKGLIKHRLPHRKPSAPFKIVVAIYPPFPVGAVSGLRVLQERLQEQFLSGQSEPINTDWSTLVLLDVIVTTFNQAMLDDIMGE